MEPALTRLGRCTDANIIADVNASVAYLKAQPFVDQQRVGIVGFCFGGGSRTNRRVTFLTSKRRRYSMPAASSNPWVGRNQRPSSRRAKSPRPSWACLGRKRATPRRWNVATINAELKRGGKTYKFHMPFRWCIPSSCRPWPTHISHHTKRPL